MRGWGQFEEVEDVSTMSSVNNPHKGKSILVTLAAWMDVVHVCVSGFFFFFNIYIYTAKCLCALSVLFVLVNNNRAEGSHFPLCRAAVSYQQ